MLYILNVPQWTTTMPPVALTCLTGYFENELIKCKQIDLNIKFYNYIFSNEFYQKKSHFFSPIYKKKLDGKCINYNEYLAQNIELALSIFKDKIMATNKKKLDWSNKLINEYLKMINSYFAPITITLNSMSFGFEGINTYSEIINELRKTNYTKVVEVYEELLNNYRFEKNSLVGFSINNLSQLINSIIITSILKQRIKASFFIGGSYLSANAKSIISCKNLFEVFDNICLYDGEHAVKNLYEHISQGKKIKYKNIISSGSNKVYRKEEYYVEDIEKLPSPSYNGIDFCDYFSPISIISLPVSRGCYGGCAFCSYNHLASSKWREQSVEQVIKSIKECIQKYNSHYFFFSVATLSPSMAKRLSEKLIEEEIKIYWATGIRMESRFDEETISLMGRAGCIRLDIGLESASQNILNDMNKRVNVDFFKNIIKNMKKNNILPYLYIIKNFPTESVEDWKITIKFLDYVKNDILGFSCYDFFLSENTTIAYEPDKFGVTIFDKKEEREDIIEKIDSFLCDKISLEDRTKKEKLLSEFYYVNKNKFMHYGNSYIDRSMPLTFPVQMLYITEKIFNEEALNVNKKYRIVEEDILVLDCKNGFFILQSLVTLHKLKIDINMYNLLNKNILVSDILKICKEKEKKRVINFFDILYSEGVLEIME